jgi:hypothetical protein
MLKEGPSMQSFLRFTIIGLVLLLTGCATTNSINTTQISTNTPLPAGQGVVALQVVNNAEELASLHRNWTEVLAFRLDNIDEVKQRAVDKAKSKGKTISIDEVEWTHDFYSLSPNNKGVIDSQLFVGSMAAGTYMISSLYSYYNDGNMVSWISMPVFQAAGRFEVKQGQLTSLGSIVFQPLLNLKEETFWNNNSSQKAFVTRLNDTVEFENFILSHYPNLANSIDFSHPLSWLEDDLDEFRNNLNQLSRQNAFGNYATELSVFAQASISARFGQLKVLTHKGEWVTIDLPTNSQLSGVFETDNLIAIGSEKGVVFIGDSIDGQWKEINPISAKEAVIWFASAANINYAITSAAMDFYVYEFGDIESEWLQVGKFEKKNRSDWLVQNGGLFPWLKADGGLRVLNDNKYYDYDRATDTWSTTKSSSMVNLKKLRNGILVALEVSQWDGIGDQVYSTDDGITWNEIDRSLRLFGDIKVDLSLPAIMDDKTLVTVSRKKVKGSTSVDLRLVSANLDNIQEQGAWQTHGKTQKNCTTLLPEITQEKRLFFLCDQGGIISTVDLGNTWQDDMQVDIAGMQKQFEALLEAIQQESKKDESMQEEQKEESTDTAELK